MRYWTSREQKLLMELYPDTNNREIADRIGRSISAIKNRAQQMGLRKSEEHLKLRAGRWQKGQEAFNKGLKGLRVPGCEKTWFKKGNRPHNCYPVGTTRCINRGYTEIKVAEPNKWEFLHRHIWEQAHGPLQPGEIVVFRDGDKTNCKLDNLQKITRGINARRNHRPERQRGKKRELTDKIVVGYMTAGKPELREEILSRPELIEAKRQEILLNRQIKKNAEKRVG